MKRRAEHQSPSTTIQTNGFLLLPSEILDIILIGMQEGECLPMSIFAARMTLGLLDRASYALFESVTQRGVRFILAFYIERHGHHLLTNSKAAWPTIRRLACLAFCGEKYVQTFDTFWDKHPLYESLFLVTFFSCINRNPKLVHHSEFGNFNPRFLYKEFVHMSPQTRRLFAYQIATISQYANRPRPAIVRADVFSSHVYTRLYVYDKASVPHDANRHYIVSLSGDKSSEIDLRGLQPLPMVSAYHGTNWLYAIESIVGFVQSFGQLLRGNLYVEYGDFPPPLNIERIARHTRDSGAFRAFLKSWAESITITATISPVIESTLQG